MRKLLALSIPLLLICCFAYAQKQGNIWYFGQKAGLNFNSGAAVAITGGQVNTSEGCASICDSSGNLLFYTDGITVWNRNHSIMTNGTGLTGDPSSTQSGVIVPYPGHPDEYFIFTVTSTAGTNGFRYSTVDMKRSGGLGAIVKKNNLLRFPTTEKITSVYHNNGRDFWVITHEWENDKFVAFRITSAGIDTLNPVESTIGFSHTGNVSYTIGQMVASPDGSRLALAAWTMNQIELYDFDNGTGKVSNPLTLPSYGSEYGVAFSPDNSKLYFSEWSLGPSSTVVQFDLSSSDPAQITASRYTVHKIAEYFGSAQIGPDGKLYIARPFKEYLAVIDRPNESKAACNFKLDGIHLAGAKSVGGLPTIIQSYFQQPTISWKGACAGDSTSFVMEDVKDTDSVSWDFGDPASGPANFSRKLSPRHLYVTPGKYTVSVEYYVNGKYYQRQLKLDVLPIPNVELPADTFLCKGDAIKLQPLKASGAEYLWNTGAKTASIDINKAGTYWLEVRNGECTQRDSMVIHPLDKYQLDLPEDTLVCEGEQFTLSPGVPGRYRWSNGDTATQMTISGAGKYWLEVTTSCNILSDTVVVRVTRPPEPELGYDTLMCKGNSLHLDVEQPYTIYRWQDGSTAPAYTISKPGKYWVEAMNICGRSADTILVTYDSIPAPYLGEDTFVCLGGSIVLHAGGRGWEYKWQDGSKESSYVVTQPGIYKVTATNACGSVSHQVAVAYEDCKCYLYMPDAFTPGNDTLNEVIKPSVCRTTDYRFQVYNRWGERIFTSEDIDKGWDGTYKGMASPEGMYLYMVRAQGIDYEIYYTSGRFYLIR